MAAKTHCEYTYIYIYMYTVTQIQICRSLHHCPFPLRHSAFVTRRKSQSPWALAISCHRQHVSKSCRVFHLHPTCLGKVYNDVWAAFEPEGTHLCGICWIGIDLPNQLAKKGRDAQHREALSLLVSHSKSFARCSKQNHFDLLKIILGFSL